MLDWAGLGLDWVLARLYEALIYSHYAKYILSQFFEYIFQIQSFSDRVQRAKDNYDKNMLGDSVPSTVFSSMQARPCDPRSFAIYCKNCSVHPVHVRGNVATSLTATEVCAGPVQDDAEETLPSFGDLQPELRVPERVDDGIQQRVRHPKDQCKFLARVLSLGVVGFLLKKSKTVR